MENRYPDNIMRVLRQRYGVDENSTDKDEELNTLTPNEVLDEVGTWDGLFGYAGTIKRWIKDIYGIDLAEVGIPKADNQIQVPITVTQQDIDDIMCTALEGGISHWAYNVYVKDNDFKGTNCTSEVVSRGGTAIISDSEGERHTLNFEKFMKGLNKWVENRIQNNRGIHLDCDRLDCGMIDADEADMIIQYACLGEIVYG